MIPSIAHLPALHRPMSACCLLALALACVGVVRADVPRALPAGELPNDARLKELKDLDGYFPFTPPATKEAWESRAEEVRRQMRVALGLWPMPVKTPLNPVIHGKIDRNDYTVEKVYFESVPGFFVTGNLYRPKGKTGRRPGVLCPHGHWDNGRFTDAGLTNVRRQIVEGAERFEEGGRSVLQSRCVQLARMGCVVFHYDMIGYADSQQIPEAIAHRFAKQRPEMNTTENWGLFSPQAEAHLQSVMGLQTWDSIRALDFLLSLPEVDAERIAVTGASGGGTQTFILCALDPRPAVAFPAVMVSTAMQGGCTCENASLLRVDTGNVEFAALFAPKPLGMTAADDWTKEMPTKGFPELKRFYTMLGAPENVALKPLLHFGHNYNYVSRAVMYSWISKQFKLELPEPVIEEDYTRLSRAEMSVWDDQHPRPEGGPDFERKLLKQLNGQAQEQLQERTESLKDYRHLVGGAWTALIGRDLNQAGEVVWTEKAKLDRGSYADTVGLLRNKTQNEELPVIILQPKQPQHQTVIWLSQEGKAGLFTGDGQPTKAVARLLESGCTVLGVDLFEQGEFRPDGLPLTRTRAVANPRESPAYTYGYNRALFAERVDDVLSIISYLQHQEVGAARVDLVALDSTGPIGAVARALARQAIRRCALNTAGFRFGHILDYRDVNFLPGGAKYEDLPGTLALNAPADLWVAGEGDGLPAAVTHRYAQAGASEHLSVYKGEDDGMSSAATDWVLRN